MTPIPMQITPYRRMKSILRHRDNHIGKVVLYQLSYTRKIAITVTLVTSLFLFSAAAKPKRQPRDQSTYERAVNVTLDAVMCVHEQHRGKLTWAELNQEVCKYMKVRRTEPWQR